MHNIEFKSELRDPIAARQQCKQLGATRMGILEQTDTYFRLADGRLKRREAPGEPTEWIFYHRRDIVRPRMCDYAILSDAQARRRWGTLNLKEWVRVVKRRELWLLDNVRIHLDEVEQIGNFLEFEAVVDSDHDTRSCHESIKHLRAVFHITMGEPVGPSYSDLVAQENEIAPT
ncbi:MAG: CYTH domain-containing protein [Planctomycetota bacterium]|nr:MAG: CYTH domain-containing protein [Planctomycetota bacterium]